MYTYGWIHLSLLHNKFIHDFYEGSKLYQSSFLILPTLIFFANSFTILFEHFHKYSRRRTPWKYFLYREIGLQSAFFYLTRIWFIVMRIFKWMNSYFEDYIEQNSPPLDSGFNQFFTKVCLTIMLTFVAFTPVLAILIQNFFRDEIPNFLLWAHENRRIRTEMGPAGQLLETAPRFTIPSRDTKTNLSRRTASAEANIWGNLRNRPACVRNCRSLGILPSLRERV